MRILLTLLLLAAPLAAQHIAASNQSDKTPLNPLAVWEEAVAVIREAEGLHDALSSGEYDFDISADACLSIRRQQRSGLPPALPSPIPTLGSNTAECEVLLSEDYVKEILHGWQWDFPTASGTEYRVGTGCDPACDYTDLETAIAAVACGSIITVMEGQTFALGTNEINLAKPCTEAAPLWIRTSAWANAAFTQGVRITPASAALLPKFTISPNDAVFDFDLALNAIFSVDTGTDTLTMTNPHGLSVGDEVYFTAGSTQPLSDTRRYWVLTTPTSTTLTVSKFENASAAKLDLTGTATGSIMQSSSWIRFTGFRIAPTPATSHNSAAIMADVITHPYLPEAKPHHIWFDHGLMFEPLPATEIRGGIYPGGAFWSVTDSYLAGIGDNSDNQAIRANGNAVGPFWGENNYLESSGMSVMIGGTLGSNLHVNPAATGCFAFKGNHMTKDPMWKQNTAAGAPTTPCVPGEIWNNTTAGTYHECDAGGASWSENAALSVEFYNFTSKNIFEIKKAECAANLGNVYELSWRDGGQDAMSLNIKQAPVAQNGPNSNTRDVVFYGEVHKRLGGAFQLANTGKDSTGRMGNVSLWNSIWYQVDPVLYDVNDDGSPSFTQRTQLTGLQEGGYSLRHLTLVPSDTTESVEHYFWTTNTTEPFDIADPVTIYDSVFGVTTVNGDGPGAVGCGHLTPSSNNLGVSAVWVWTFGGGDDLTSCSVNYYGETNFADVGFADWTGTTLDDFRITSAGTTRDYRAGGAADASDGKDQGADIDIVKDLTGGAEAGLLSWSEQFGVAITAVGSTTATVEWDRPNAANACNFYLYSDYARTTEHADTSGDNGDNRDGGVSAGHVTFTLGTNSALTTKTWYWFEIDCPTDSVRMVGSLFTN